MLGCYLNERFDAHRDVIAFLSNEQCTLEQNHVTLGFSSKHPELVLIAKRKTLYQTFENRTERFIYVRMLKATSWKMNECLLPPSQHSSDFRKPILVEILIFNDCLY